MVKPNILEQMHQEGRLSLLFLTAGISAQISRSVALGALPVGLYFNWDSQELQEEGKNELGRVVVSPLFQ